MTVNRDFDITGTPVLAGAHPATDSDTAGDEWQRFGIRDLPSMSARTRFVVPEMLVPLVEERVAELGRPYVGITTDGVARDDLRMLDDLPRVDTAPMAAAVSAFLNLLTADQREQACYPMHADEWRQWINVHMNFYRHGVMLEDLPGTTRELALNILQVTLSTRGFEQARSIMAINELVAELTGDHEAFGGWLYFLTVFGSPGGTEPWGWQIDGHHLCLNVAVVDDRIVTTPAFMGSEPRAVHHGPYAGISLFDPEESLGIRLLDSLGASQRASAIIHPSIATADLPPQLQHPFDGRMLAGGAHDNLIVPCQGVAGADLGRGQQRILLELIGTYVKWTAENQARARLREVEAHLHETWFSWYGGTDADSPFYYRVHSPVILVEFDHHPGVVFDNLEPTRHHVHTLVRTPHGGDYGVDLLRQHHAKFDHNSGVHRIRHSEEAGP